MVKKKEKEPIEGKMLPVKWKKIDGRNYTATKGDIVAHIDVGIEYWYVKLYRNDEPMNVPWKPENEKFFIKNEQITLNQIKIQNILKNRWDWFTGEAQKREKEKNEKEKDDNQTQIILKNITYFKELIFPNETLDQKLFERLLLIGKALFDDFVLLFNKRENYLSMVIAHEKLQENWRNLPSINKEREIFSHEEKYLLDRGIRESNPYWDSDQIVYHVVERTRRVDVPNPQYIEAPTMNPKIWETRKEINKIEEEIKEKAIYYAEKVYPKEDINISNLKI